MGTVTGWVGALYRVILSLWVGGITLFTFLLTPALFRSLGRDEAGRVVGILFPVYFPYNLALSATGLVVLLVLARGSWRSTHWLSAFLLLVAVAANAYVQFGLHPRAREVKAEIHSFEALSPEHPLRREFARLHAISASINLFLLVEGLTLLLLEPRLRR